MINHIYISSELIAIKVFFFLILFNAYFIHDKTCVACDINITFGVFAKCLSKYDSAMFLDITQFMS